MSSFTQPLEYTFINKYKKGRKLYRIDKEFTYLVGSVSNPILKIDVPVGFITDLASIPVFLHWLFKPDGKWVKAAVIHDYLYSKDYNYPMSKVMKDAIFLEGMLVLKVKQSLAYLFFTTVRIATEIIFE